MQAPGTLLKVFPGWFCAKLITSGSLLFFILDDVANPRFTKTCLCSFLFIPYRSGAIFLKTFFSAALLWRFIGYAFFTGEPLA